MIYAAVVILMILASMLGLMISWVMLNDKKVAKFIVWVKKRAGGKGCSNDNI